MDQELKFIQVGELAKGISEFVLPDSDDLIGQTLRLFFDDGSAVRIKFNSVHKLFWEELDADGRHSCGTEIYRATSPREGIYLLDYILKDRHATTVSLVLDFNLNIATAVIGTLPSETQTLKDPFTRVREGLELTCVTARFLRATIERPFEVSDSAHATTLELVGRRIKYTYSRTEAYEHIYLNDKLYTWHCLKGIEKGLADTDRCHYYKIAASLYLFVWREKIIPTLGLVLVDLDRLKTTGKLFGYAGEDFGRLVNAPIGAHAQIL